MKVVILAGGFGTRISEETELLPKPMIQIGGKPILWHIMKSYSYYGHTEFIILLGYKGYIIKEYFSNYFLHQNDVTIDLAANKMHLHNNCVEPWTVTLIDTGLNTMTGGRIKKAKKHIGEEAFLLTYGDGVSDVDINQLIEFHKKYGKIVTMTAVKPEGRFGSIDLEGDQIISFLEKPKEEGAWINGGFMVCQPEVFKYIDDLEETVFEKAPLESLAKDGQLCAFKHNKFWKPMDTLRDKMQLDQLISNNQADWIKWK